MYERLALSSNQASRLIIKHSNELNPERKQLKFETFFSNKLFVKSREDRLSCLIDIIYTIDSAFINAVLERIKTLI